MINLTKHLQPGQVVELKELESGSRIITILSADQSGPRVVEVGCDYVLVGDEAEGCTLRLPVHFVHSIVPQATETSQAA